MANDGMRQTVPTAHGDVLVHFRKWKRMAGEAPVEALYYDFFLLGKRHRGSTETRNIRIAHEVAREKVADAADASGKPKGAGLPLAVAVDVYLDGVLLRAGLPPASSASVITATTLA